MFFWRLFLSFCLKQILLSFHFIFLWNSSCISEQNGSETGAPAHPGMHAGVLRKLARVQAVSICFLHLVSRSKKMCVSNLHGQVYTFFLLLVPLVSKPAKEFILPCWTPGLESPVCGLIPHGRISGHLCTPLSSVCCPRVRSPTNCLFSPSHPTLQVFLTTWFHKSLSALLQFVLHEELLYRLMWFRIYQYLEGRRHHSQSAILISF